MNSFKKVFTAGLAAAALLAGGMTASAGFQEYPIGDEQEDTVNHFKVALVYFQPVQMEPATNAASVSENGSRTSPSTIN